MDIREYKLIKKYPGLPHDWEEGMLVGHGDYQDQIFRPVSSKYRDMAVRNDQVQDFPEFWEKVEKKLLFITEDGYYITEDLRGLELYGVLTKGDWRTQLLPAERWLSHNDSWKVFYDEKKMKKYREENIPQYSLKELYQAVDFWGLCGADKESIAKQVEKFRNELR